MKFAKLFEKCSWLYVLILGLLTAGAIVMALQMPELFINWVVGPLFGYTAGVFAVFALLGYEIAALEERKLPGLILIPFFCGFVGAGTMYLLFGVVTFFLGVTRTATLAIAMVLIFIQLAILDAHILSLASDFFRFGEEMRNALTIVLIVVMMGVTVTPFATSFARSYLRVYDFLTEPAVFVNGSDGYSVLFATTGEGTGSVVVKKDGVITTYNEEKYAVILYNRKIHRVDIPKTALEGATYYVQSTQCKDGTNVDWVMGRTIQGKSYVFKKYEKSGDVSFLCVSDNQGTAIPTQTAVRQAYENNDYDFVMMLGDHAESYNDMEKDVADSMLKVAAIASGSILPVYYTMGNHEYRGDLAPYFWDLIPTGSDTGEQYYTFTMGDAFFSVFNFANDHNDEMKRYAGLGDFNGYKDIEYEWYKSAMQSKPYEGYAYHIAISHIPMIYNDNLPAYEHECAECKAIHGYKYYEFAELYKEIGVQYAVSGHTHVKPAEYKSDKYAYTNLHAGSHYNNKNGFRNSIVTLSGGKITYKTYGE